MFDPMKLLFVLVVAIVVLGPDKLPSAARRLGSLLADLQRWRLLVREEAQRVVGDLPFSEELRGVKQTLAGAHSSLDPRQALLRAVGVDEDTPTAAREGTAGETTPVISIPGSIDLASTAPELLLLPSTREQRGPEDHGRCRPSSLESRAGGSGAPNRRPSRHLPSDPR